jgi:hypothetical protein
VFALAFSPGAAIAPSPAAAVPLARPAALHDAAPSALLRVKARVCKNVCAQWKPCPPISHWYQPDGCWVGTYPNLQHLDKYCAKYRKVCSPSFGTHPSNRFSTSPQLLGPEPELSPGSSPAPAGSAAPTRGPSRGR